MSEIRLRNVTKTYDKDNTVIKDLNLVIPEGSFTVLVGPSGCGKSTTLRMIAGLETMSEGELYIGNELMNEVSPGDRDIAMVFQNYALYPTMSVRGNIEFGLINKKVPKEEREQLIDEIIDIVGLRDYLDKKPSQLSGGQRQRVALARAMVKKPKVFLMDEPLSNLDAKLRTQMRTELVELHKRLQTTFVYVTHDQVEAMSMATNIVLMKDGEIQQQAIPYEIYTHPSNVFTAQFIGTPVMNVIEADALKSKLELPEGCAYIGFRPSRVYRYHDGAPTENIVRLEGEILTHELLGSEIIYRLKTPLGIISFKTFHEDEVPQDTHAEVYIKRKNMHFFDSNQKRIV